MAERVIVVVRGRLAAAGGHHAIRDAMDDVPRQVLVRCADPRRLAAALVGLEAVGGDHRGRRRRIIVSTKRARDLAIALPRAARDSRRAHHGGAAARRLAREPLPGAGAMTSAAAVRRHARPLVAIVRLHAAHVPAGEAVDRDPAARAAAAVLFGLLARALDRAQPTTTSPRWPSTRSSGSCMPVTCLVVGDAVLGAEIRSGAFAFTWLSPVPTWQIVLGRWIGGSIVAVGLPERLPSRCPPSSPAPDRAPAPWPGRRRSARWPTWRCSSPSAASLGGPRCGRWPSCSSSSGCSARHSTASRSSHRAGRPGQPSWTSPTVRPTSCAPASPAARPRWCGSP